MADETGASGVVKRCAILGTAPTWRQTPWNDPTLEIWALNDSYLLGFPRADRWYDLHPFDQFFYRDPKQRKIPADQVPAGTYVRPDGHLDWLARQSIPVYVQQADPRVPRARVFPYAELRAAFDPIFPSTLRDGLVVPGHTHSSSTPQWMLMQAMFEGYRQVYIMGIHLATAWEYQRQRELFAFLIGVARGRGIDVVIPEDAPLVKARYEYAYQPDPEVPITALQRRTDGLKREREAAAKALAALPWYGRGRPELAARVRWLDAQIADGQAAAGQLAIAQRIAVG